MIVQCQCVPWYTDDMMHVPPQPTVTDADRVLAQSMLDPTARAHTLDVVAALDDERFRGAWCAVMLTNDLDAVKAFHELYHERIRALFPSIGTAGG